MKQRRRRTSGNAAKHKVNPSHTMKGIAFRPSYYFNFNGGLAPSVPLARTHAQTPAPVASGQLVHWVCGRVSRGGHEQDPDRRNDDVHGVNHDGEEDERHGRREVGLPKKREQARTRESIHTRGRKGITNRWTHAYQVQGHARIYHWGHARVVGTSVRCGNQTA